MEKDNNIPKNRYFECFQFITYKNVKSMESTLYEETKRHYEKRVFVNVFFCILGTKT